MNPFLGLSSSQHSLDSEPAMKSGNALRLFRAAIERGVFESAKPFPGPQEILQGDSKALWKTLAYKKKDQSGKSTFSASLRGQETKGTYIRAKCAESPDCPVVFLRAEFDGEGFLFSHGPGHNHDDPTIDRITPECREIIKTRLLAHPTATPNQVKYGLNFLSTVNNSSIIQFKWNSSRTFPIFGVSCGHQVPKSCKRREISEKGAFRGKWYPFRAKL